jgi:hypothetical protein
VTITKQSGTGTISSVTDNGNGTYTATVTAPTATGSGVFVATLNSGQVKSGNASQTQATVTYVPGPADSTQSTLTPVSSSITANGTATQVLTVTAKDANGNPLTTGGATVTITKQSGTGTISSVTDNGNGTYTATVTAPNSSGSGVFVATLNSNPVKSGSASQTQATVTYVSSNLTYTATGPAQTWTSAAAKNVSYPTGTSTNDLLLLVYVAASNKAPTVPAAWTLLTTDNQGANIMTRVYWKLAAGADGGQVSVTPGDTGAASAWVVQYVRPSGYPPNPDVATATTNHGNANSATTVTTSGVTTNAANATVISIVGDAQAATALSLSTANGYALRTQASANGLSFGLADELVSTSGTATSAPIWSSAPTSAAWAWSTDAFH